MTTRIKVVFCQIELVINNRFSKFLSIFQFKLKDRFRTLERAYNVFYVTTKILSPKVTNVKFLPSFAVLDSKNLIWNTFGGLRKFGDITAKCCRISVRINIFLFRGQLVNLFFALNG